MKRASAGQRFGKYRLLERLGLGGTAEVWKAELSGPMGFARTVVLKRLLPELVADPSSVALLVDEARLSARLHHAAIVQVLELEQIDGEWVLALEYVDGCDLRRLLRAQTELGPPDPGLGAYVVHEICRALAYAHELIIHRDVSPSNVMLSESGAVKLVDFGLAKALGGDTTRTGSFKGNLAYMAPEQLAGQPLDGRTDLYAAGVVLHETLTARRLFKAADLAGMSALRGVRIDPPSRSNPRVPPELDAVCARALAVAPANRYANAAEMAAALEGLVHRLGFGPTELGRLVRARPVTVAPVAEPHDAGRVTATHGATVEPAQRRSWRVAIAALVLVGALASLAWWITRPEVLPVPAPAPPAPIPIAAPVVVPAPEPVVVEAPKPTPSPPPAAPHHKPSKRAPDMVKGKLVNPFGH